MSSTGVKNESQIGQATTGQSVLNIRAQKVARVSSSGATIGAAIVQAENNLELEVCFPASAF